MKPQLAEELKALARRCNGRTLKAKEVLEWAKGHPDSALHKEFEWNVNEAARRHWLSKARELIRAYVIILPTRPKPVRGLISVPSDRTQTGGYRKTENVLGKQVQRMEMINEALTRLGRMRQNYSYLEELDSFFDDLDRLIERYRGSIGLEDSP